MLSLPSVVYGGPLETRALVLGGTNGSRNAPSCTPPSMRAGGSGAVGLPLPPASLDLSRGRYFGFPPRAFSLFWNPLNPGPSGPQLCKPQWVRGAAGLQSRGWERGGPGRGGRSSLRTSKSAVRSVTFGFVSAISVCSTCVCKTSQTCWELMVSQPWAKASPTLQLVLTAAGPERCHQLLFCR